MGTERLKSDLTHESTSKETELDEIRGHYQRRLRALEDQLDDLQSANSTLLKENRVLEARARQFDISRQSFEFSGGQYRRELRRVQALLADTQAVLAHERECAPSQLLLLIKLQDEVDALQQQIKEANCGREKESEALRKARKENVQLQETIGELEKRHLDSEHKKKASNVEIDRLEEANKILTAELKLAQRRIDSLQLALSEGLEGEDSDEENEDCHALEDGRSAG
ncbi:unnamed protein product [Angiostrongylus costaricensis]|uniref:Protein phosphatase 1 regulatory subunit 21 n=1 Tax=Angiostrongylus costaricensis TaxID=334426 RepID=A0A158PL77_ANGCS|nr:unnamed protein product [Angiostrongylus costaricensis]